MAGPSRSPSVSDERSFFFAFFSPDGLGSGSPPLLSLLTRPVLEVFVARKIGAPDHPEFGIGAIAEG